MSQLIRYLNDRPGSWTEIERPYGRDFSEQVAWLRALPEDAEVRIRFTMQASRLTFDGGLLNTFQRENLAQALERARYDADGRLTLIRVSFGSPDPSQPQDVPPSALHKIIIEATA